jgi:sulfur carrier protein ThiS
MREITIGKVPGTLSSIAVEDGATVADALEAANLDADGFEIRLNGSVANLNDIVTDGAKVFLVKKIKGNQSVVTVGKVPGTLQELAVESGATVEDVLELADLDADGFEIRLNGSVADLDSTVSDGSKVFLVKKIKGNQSVVTVGKVPGTLQELAVESGTTVREVLELADLDADGFEIRLNGSVADLDSTVSDGSKVFLVKKIKGNE